MLGSGAVIVIDDRCCMVQLGLRVAQFYMHESCGKCTPCREGTRWMVQILREDRGRATATQGDLDLLLDVCDRILGKCLCPLGDAAAMPVASYIDKFRDEFQAHIDRAAARSAASRRSRASSRPSTSTRTCPVAEVPGVSARRARHGHDRRPRGRRCRRAQGSSRPPRRPGSRSRSSATSRGSAPPVGACRMCLVEVEGMPKLQAGCTLTAQDGMVVRTAQTSAKAAEGQNATLEFILVNHPLDCPVCDKGGECPLQDLTFRYGPGHDADDVPEADVRQADPDLADDRARPRALHPLLPLHALLRGRRRGRPARRA